MHLYCIKTYNHIYIYAHSSKQTKQGVIFGSKKPPQCPMLCKSFSPFGYHILWASRFNGQLSFPRNKLKRLWKDDANQPVLRVLNDFRSEIDRFSAYDADNSNDIVMICLVLMYLLVMVL